jgi:hypothetical protein
MESIIATIAHELQHLSGFSNITAQQEEYGLKDPFMEEVFLEEGLSHLAESLSGYGQSGGNIVFVSWYLDSTASYPLGPSTEAGYGDSVGRRGGMALLLSWLFYRSGGMDFLADGTVVDTGGISFLRSISLSRYRGWKRIEEAAGISQTEIMQEFCRFLLSFNGFSCPSDFYTNEPILPDPFAGEIVSAGETFVLNGPKFLDLEKSLVLPPFALAFGTPLHFESPKYITVERDSAALQSSAAVRSSATLYLIKD